MSLAVRFFIFIGLVVLAVLAGMYLGRLSVGDDPVSLPRTTHMTVSAPRATDPEQRTQPSESALGDPPLYLYVGHATDEDWNLVGEQVALAAAAGIERYIAPVNLVWSEKSHEEKSAYYNGVLERYVSWVPQARVLMKVNLNPPLDWIEAHPESAMLLNDALQPYPSPTSSIWRETARTALEQLITAVESGPYREHVLGYVLGALANQRWMLPEQPDVSEANRSGFAQWLRRHYGSDTALRNAWACMETTFDSALIPQMPAADDTTHVFLSLPEMQPVADYLRYSSETVADTLAIFAALTARTSVISPIIGAFYGLSFETPSNAAGQFALIALINSDLNTLISPVSYADRGLGGVGGMMGPIDSWTNRGKQWLLLDDTRTGVERDPETNEFSRIKGIRAEDVYEVQRRNFAMALTYGLGLVWSDPRAEGWLYDAEQWRQLGKLRDTYAHHQTLGDQQHEETPSTVLTVVVDEDARFIQQCAGPLNTALLLKSRDAVLRTGVAARFHLLRDIIEDQAPPTPVYLFLNAFHLTDEDRARLHSRLAREQATVIWMYAPGYVSDAPDVENIALTTGMDVRVFEAPRPGGSLYMLTGQYMQTDQRFGSGETWAPLFYIAPEENTDILARYEGEENKGSVAILTLPEGWTSVYIAEPELPPALLCEILRLLEQHLLLSPVERPYYDAVFARNNLIAFHASQAGKRALAFGYFCDSEDLIDPAIGWLQKDTVMLTVRTGETRLMRHGPIRAGAL